MQMPVAEVLLRFSSAEITEWMAYDRIDPFGGFRGDVQAAVIASTIANVHRGRNSPVRKIEDFLPFQPRKKQSQEEVDNQIKRFFTNFGKK